MNALEALLIRGSQVVAVLGALALLLVAGLSVVDIGVREVTGRPLRGAHDIAGLLIIVIVATCFPAGLLERRQIKVTIIRTFIPSGFDYVLRVIAAILTGLMFAAIAWYLTRHAINVTNRAEYSMVLRWPVAPWWWAAAILFWACVPAQLFVVIAEMLGHEAEDEGV